MINAVLRCKDVKKKVKRRGQNRDNQRGTELQHAWLTERAQRDRERYDIGKY